jgi:RNA polymerase sigma-70 factor (ECF subfamily)
MLAEREFMADGAPELTVQDLVDQHYALVYRVAYRMAGSAADAEDLTQQVFLTACDKSNQVRHPEAVRGWLLTILKHACLRQKVKQSRQSPLPLEELPDPEGDALEATEIDPEELQAALGDLPVEFRLPVVLFYFEDLSYKEIADRVGAPIGTVMSRLSRGRSYLRRRLAASQPAAM